MDEANSVLWLRYPTLAGDFQVRLGARHRLVMGPPHGKRGPRTRLAIPAGKPAVISQSHDHVSQAYDHLSQAYTVARNGQVRTDQRPPHPPGSAPVYL